MFHHMVPKPGDILLSLDHIGYYFAVRAAISGVHGTAELFLEPGRQPALGAWQADPEPMAHVLDHES